MSTPLHQPCNAAKHALRGLFLTLLTLLAACISTPDFEDASRIDRPRVLAVIAEPPEVAPGEPVSLSLMLAGFEAPPTSVEWLACGAFTSTMGGRQYGDEADRKGCGNGTATVPLGGGTRTSIPAQATQLFFDNVDLAADTFGAVLPPGTVATVKSQVGLALLIEARVSHGNGQVFRATKRIVVRDGDGHENPPPPAFAIDGIDIAGAKDSFSCQPTSGEPLRLQPGQQVELVPATPASDEEEPWLEDYYVLNARAELVMRKERAFYSWYVDHGKLAEGITKSPLRNNLYTASKTAGCQHMWLVVQDGHGGASACQLEFLVGDAECP